MNTSDGSKPRTVTSLRELRTDAPPGRDLWPAIASQIGSPVESPGAGDAGSSNVVPLRAAQTRPRWMTPLALAATVAVLAVGIGVGRWTSTDRASPPIAVNAPATSGTPAVQGAPAALPAAWLPGPKYQVEREARLRVVQERISKLPPQSRAKVEASLAALETSLRDIQAALGRDPANALLQELLVNTYQDEMRVLVDIETARTSNVNL